MCDIQALTRVSKDKVQKAQAKSLFICTAAVCLPPSGEF